MKRDDNKIAARKRVGKALSTVSSRQGMTLLLVIIIVSALLSIGLELFQIIQDEILLSGQITDSFIGFYAADEGIERTLYMDRNAGPLADGFTMSAIPTSSQACYTARVSKGVGTRVKVNGQYRCGGVSALGRIVIRGFEVDY